ncbi:hypothetical protein BJ138DRAFT_1120604 [Hygrophoropsis aurantiaca]|uniref:Uncharacterized protein n=1 Tax=Hygrophoropsis aurantiaca TaxID=72124 RepID=A0ACB7ZQ45_9AGAM|nr:hypothetical protein BJ138DRAFT_1120604 [Hygrophoropsis aurantiaca]
MEMQWTVLAQAFIPPSLQSLKSGSGCREAMAHGRYAVVDATAANKAWLALMCRAGCDLRLDVNASEDGDGRENTGAHTKDALMRFSALTSCLRRSRKLASIYTITLRELDDELHTLLTLLLSDAPPVSDNLVQEAALKAATSNCSSSTYTNFIDTLGAIIISSHLSFPEIAQSLVNHLWRFVTSPLRHTGSVSPPQSISSRIACLDWVERLSSDLYGSNRVSGTSSMCAHLSEYSHSVTTAASSDLSTDSTLGEDVPVLVFIHVSNFPPLLVPVIC